MQTKENAWLRLKGEYEYNNGTPYVEYLLLRDAPHIPATRSSANPRHGIAGDVIRVEDDDELTPFELRRNGKCIGDPEWWMVRDLFDGLPSPLDTWAPEEAKAPTGRGLLGRTEVVLSNREIVKEAWVFLREPEIKPTALYKVVPVRAGSVIGKCPGTVEGRFYQWRLWSALGEAPQPIGDHDACGYLALDRLERDARYDRARAAVASLHRGAAYLERDVLDLRAGDVVVQGWEPPAFGGLVAPLTLEHYGALRAEYDAGKTPLTELLPFIRPWSTATGTIRDKKTWRLRRRVWTTGLWRVRFPSRSPVSRPVVASNDVAALFELLAQVGGRMPKGDARA